MTFANRLVMLRELRGLTQATLAKKAGITTRALQNYETTERRPKGEYLSRLANALEVPESALLADEAFERFVMREQKNKSIGGVSSVDSVIPLVINTHEKLISSFSSTLSSINSTLSELLKCTTEYMKLFNWSGIKEITANSHNKEHAQRYLNNVYKEISRINSLQYFIQEAIYNVQSDYIAVSSYSQENDANINEYKSLIQIGDLLRAYQDYLEILKQKRRLYEGLIHEIENHYDITSKNALFIVNEIQNIERKEREYAAIIIQSGNTIPSH